jgi:predicted phage baseplate assembly protein
VPGLEGLHKITLAAPVAYADFPQTPDDTETVVFGNVVDADQGKTEPEAAIGSGDGRSSFQTFKLPKAPLTYHQAPSQTPPQAPGLEVTVADRTWTRVESLFGQGPDAEVYVVREDADGGSWIQFGDGGEFGARLPSGVDNVRVTARSGAGAHGPLKEGTKVLPGRLDRLQAVQLPGVVAGGSEPETPEVARATAPGRVQSLGRLVSLSDFEAEALALPGVVLASAAWSIAHGVPTVTVTVLMEHGREAEHAAMTEALRAAARDRGADRFEIAVVQGHFRSVKLRADVAVADGYDPDAVLSATRDALGVDPAPDGLFSVKRRRFGQPEHVTHVAGVIQQVSGVSWARVAGSDKTLACPPNRVLRLPDVNLAAVSGVPA